MDEAAALTRERQPGERDNKAFISILVASSFSTVQSQANQIQLTSQYYHPTRSVLHPDRPRPEETSSRDGWGDLE